MHCCCNSFDICQDLQNAIIALHGAESNVRCFYAVPYHAVRVCGILYSWTVGHFAQRRWRVLRTSSPSHQRVFWSFAASHFTSLQRINLYRIYIHQGWEAAASAALQRSVVLELRSDVLRCSVLPCALMAICKSLTCSDAFRHRHRPLGSLDKSLKTLTLMILASIVHTIETIHCSRNLYLLDFVQCLMRSGEDFTIYLWWSQLKELPLWSDPFNGVGIATRKWRKLQIFAALHHYVVLWYCAPLCGIANMAVVVSLDQATILAETSSLLRIALLSSQFVRISNTFNI